MIRSLYPSAKVVKRYPDDIAEVVEQNLWAVRTAIKKYFPDFYFWPDELRERSISAGMLAIANAARSHTYGSFLKLAYTAIYRLILNEKRSYSRSFAKRRNAERTYLEMKRSNADSRFARIELASIN